MNKRTKLLLFKTIEMCYHKIEIYNIIFLNIKGGAKMKDILIDSPFQLIQKRKKQGLTS